MVNKALFFHCLDYVDLLIQRYSLSLIHIFFYSKFISALLQRYRVYFVNQVTEMNF